MRPLHYAQLCAAARRVCGDAGMAEDIVQDALLAAVGAGRADLAEPGNIRWLCGVVRYQAKMALRAQLRRQHRETKWQLERGHEAREAAPSQDVLASLPRAQRVVAALILTGHSRREIAYLLDLRDDALRQRIAALRRSLKAAGVPVPHEFSGLGLDLAYGRIRDALLPQLRREGGTFASHDPDGHLFVVRRSQGG